MTQEELEAVQGRTWEELVAALTQSTQNTDCDTASTTKYQVLLKFRQQQSLGEDDAIKCTRMQLLTSHVMRVA